ncbi:hypothetical protein ACFVRD_35975 [Streptomyces sp. NPDC057908]|uniref:hypothetical protein n=1 Tax=Streptomyces sp. NPDC057908 TaxID=3346276 RepID=UPI0036ED65EF
MLQQEATRLTTGLLPAYWKHAIDESVWIPQEPAPKPSVNGLVEELRELPQ